MKKSESFWRSLEVYSWVVVGRSPLPWQWIGVGLVVIVLLASALNVKNSVVGTRDLREVIEKAAERGDYETARILFDKTPDVRLEDKVYPERKVQRRIVELEAKLVEYPGNREIFFNLAELYDQIGNDEVANEYRERARILDPNEVEF